MARFTPLGWSGRGGGILQHLDAMSRIPLISGDEFDALTKGGRARHIFKAGDRKRIKRGFRRRFRRLLNKSTIAES